jgi:hypothetical protein
VSHVAEPCAASCPSLSPVQQGVHIRDRVGIAVQAVHILFGLQLNLQSDAVRIMEVEGLAVPPFDNFTGKAPYKSANHRFLSRGRGEDHVGAMAGALPITNKCFSMASQVRRCAPNGPAPTSRFRRAASARRPDRAIPGDGATGAAARDRSSRRARTMQDADVTAWSATRSASERRCGSSRRYTSSLPHIWHHRPRALH